MIDQVAMIISITRKKEEYRLGKELEGEMKIRLAVFCNEEKQVVFQKKNGNKQQILVNMG